MQCRRRADIVTEVVRELIKALVAGVLEEVPGNPPVIVRMDQQKSSATKSANSGSKLNVPANGVITPRSVLPCVDLPIQPAQGLCVQPCAEASIDCAP
jgi:hypothetical protein